MTVEEYDTLEYQMHCRSLLTGLVEELLDYRRHGVELVGLLGIADSPSCCTKEGIFFRVIMKELITQKIELKTISVPTDHQENKINLGFMRKIKEILD